MIRERSFDEVNAERLINWQMSRGSFLKSLVFLGVATQLSCTSSENSTVDDVLITPLMNNQQAKIIMSVQAILFPADGNGPSAKEINAFPYLLWFLQDDLLERYERDFHVFGADWVNQEAQKMFNEDFLSLPQTVKEKFIGLLAKDKKIKQWLSKMLTLIFEALLADSAYGGNPNNVGWNWLSHNPGAPRSDKSHLYPQINNTVRNEI